jgi:hypothetical protein
MGIHPQIVVGSRWNLKVTTHEDWPVAEFLAQKLERFFVQSLNARDSSCGGSPSI